ncbi:hypothetical protein E1263_02820 [Kribbella antibiotica]|uniref:Uncharacterized protein n=1 Tax=Kribbella antibiotica TaxID=190195 RepID=A0A4V2YQN1_9ACTN|nr:hypothetical protein [Kribbella antibiotica]TDD62667.1 hypothetical protein E1263_02820 [Kribbella antibiotica]
MRADGAADRQSLPFRLDHPFQLWSYSRSHSTLVLRGRPGAGYDHFVDVVFSGVLGMKVASGYNGLTVAVSANRAEIDEFLHIPDRHQGHLLQLELSDEVHRGFVVCGRVVIRRGAGWPSPSH